MGVFAVIGLLVGLFGIGAQNPRICFVGLLLIGLGVAGDTNGF